jgi:hypothetical protein
MLSLYLGTITQDVGTLLMGHALCSACEYSAISSAAGLGLARILWCQCHTVWSQGLHVVHFADVDHNDNSIGYFNSFLLVVSRAFLIYTLRPCRKGSFKRDPSLFQSFYPRPRPERLIKIISTRYFLVIKEINRYLVDMILINSFRSRHNYWGGLNCHLFPMEQILLILTCSWT